MLTRALKILPRGTLAVGAGLVILGAASYIHLAVAGHALTDAGMSSLSVLWSIVFAIGLGLFFPIEQEVTRLVAARHLAGDGAGPIYRRAAILSAALLCAVGLLTLAFGPTLAGRLFHGDTAMLWAMWGGFAGLAVAHPTRGILAGTGRFAGYGTQLGIDGALRIVLALTLAAAGVHTPLAYALILAVAPILATIATTTPIRAGATPGTPMSWVTLRHGLPLLIISTLLAQLVVNISVIDVKLFAPGDDALAAALLSALVLARIPLFVFASLQASLLPGLAGALASGDHTGFRRLLLRACAIVTALMVLGGVPTVVAGPWLIRTLFDAPDVLTTLDFTLLVAGTGAYLLAMVLGQGVLAMNRHRDQMLAWALGTAALIGVTLLPGDIKTRVEYAYLAGSTIVALTLAVMLRQPPHTPIVDQDAPPTTLVAWGGAD